MNDKKQTKASLIAELKELRELCKRKDRCIAELKKSEKMLKGAEEELIEREAQLSAFFNNAVIGIAWADTKGNYIKVNKFYLSMFGYESKEELFKKTVSEVTHPDDRMETRKAQLKLEGVVIDYFRAEKRYVRKDGSIFWGDVSVSPIIESDGIIHSFIAVINDITERKIAEEALRSSRERFKDLTEMLPEGVFETDKEMNVIYANQRAFDLLGYSKEDLAQGLSGLNMVIPKERDQVKANFAMRVKGKDPGTVEYQALKKDGSTFPVLFHASSIMKDGEFSGLRGIVVDITQHKRAEETLRKSEERFRDMFEFSPNSTIITDMEGNIIVCNKQFVELHAAKGGAEAQIGRKITEFFPEEELPHLFSTIEKMITDRQRQGPVEFKLLRDNGTIFQAETWCTLIYDTERKPEAILAHAYDITERKQFEEERAKASKLESIGLLAGGIAHDFNNILGSILGNTTLAKMCMDNRSKAERLLSGVEKASLRAKELTQQLLTFSKGGAPVKELSYLPELIRETAQFSLRGSNVLYKTSIPSGLWPVVVDNGQFSQVISNLVINAQQAMPEGGTIHIIAENDSVTSKDSLPIQNGDYVKICIKDSGHGIPSKHVSKIFDPYFTTKQKGSGLGLASTYSIIRKHDGHIAAESKVGVGTTFHIYLPASSKSEKTMEIIRENKPVYTGKILVMDDDKDLREVIKDALSHFGHEVEVAAGGDEALSAYKKAKKSGKPFDVVIMDITVPGGMGGKETIKKLLEFDPGVKAIVSSGYSTDQVISNYSEYGFCNCITKPFKLVELKEIINKVLSDNQ